MHTTTASRSRLRNGTPTHCAGLGAGVHDIDWKGAGAPLDPEWHLWDGIDSYALMMGDLDW